MTALIFGSPEAAAQLQRDRLVAELDDLVREYTEYNYCIDPYELSAFYPHLLPLIREYVKVGQWEYWKETHEDSDGNVTVTEEVYRPGEAIRRRLEAEVQP